ncbi:MAG: hypothetical protein HN742_41695 [Lentisphaerae bacterium]|jgi:uroporphyrinogen decarboxylase|nr:hypothetical protein [Lentisphaerota bacterium]MBT4814047.1 hypothetical protein [Lentisphaerota bacterium]MBT5611711.1 hypothetical protein [Lentisphaerota bacterium]MBT7060449.1 hypothetical protein [Lentisphaerota bacterium]MBT7848452.1 hypothetical protein [Lentisphaerota bacterium]
MHQMTSRERLLAAYRHQPVDRVPCSPRITYWLIDHYGDASLGTHLRAAEEFGFDLHHNAGVYWSPFELGARDSYDLPGVEYSLSWGKDGAFDVAMRTFRTPAGTLTDRLNIPPRGDRSFGMAPNPFRTEHLVKTRDDLGPLRYLLPDPARTNLDPYFQQAEQVGENGLVQLNVHSALNHRAGEMMGTEDLMMLYYDDAPFFAELMDIGHQQQLAEIRAALDAGVRHFFLNWYYNSMSAGWSPSFWTEYFQPQLRETCEVIHAADGTANLYDDGKCMAIINLVADAGIDVLETLTPPPVGDVDLAEAKRRIGDRVCLKGHTDLIYVLKLGTPVLVEQTVRNAIEAAGPTGFILGTSDGIRDGTPIENVRAYFNAARTYGCQKEGQL